MAHNRERLNSEDAPRLTCVPDLHLETLSSSTVWLSPHRTLLPLSYIHGSYTTCSPRCLCTPSHTVCPTCFEVRSSKHDDINDDDETQQLYGDARWLSEGLQCRRISGRHVRSLFHIPEPVCCLTLSRDSGLHPFDFLAVRGVINAGRRL